MLFAFDADGVPSVARLVSVAPRSSARVGTDWIPAFGTSNDGTAFTAACPTGRVLAGVSGSADTKLRAVTPLCVSVNGSGSWVGKPVPGNPVGPAAVRSSRVPAQPEAPSRAFGAGPATMSTPSTSSAASSALVPSGTGNPSYLGAVGGTGGLARSAYRCGTNNPAYALYGRTGTTLRGFGLRCRRPTV